MSFINKISAEKIKLTGNLTESIKPNLRFDDWIGRKKPNDNRTTKELLTNIDYFAENMPEVAKFKKELKSMNPKHLSLVSDICELTRYDLNNKNINIKEKAAKENPESLDFAQEVINHTDATGAKYFLSTCPGYFEHPEAAKHLSATKPLIKDIADSVFEGFPLLDYSKESLFVNTIKNFINPSVNPKNIETLQSLVKIVEKTGQEIEPIAFLKNNINLD